MTILVMRSRALLLSFPNLVTTNSLPLSSLAPPFPPLDPNDDEAVVSAAVSVLREQRSKSRWRFLRSLFHPSGFTPAQAAEIVRCLRNSPHLALRFFLWSRRRRLCLHDLRSYATAAHVLARSRVRPAALSLLRSAILSHEPQGTSPSNPLDLFEALVRTYRACDSAPFVFDLLITAYLRSNNLGLALDIARLLRSRGIHPQVSTSNSLIRSTSRSRGFDAALELYRELFEHEGKTRARAAPNVHTFNVLLLALYREDNLNRAGEIRREMGQAGCDPNAFTYSVLMAGLCDGGRAREARSLWDEMAGKGIKPDIVAFNTLINGYCKAREVDKAEELYREMVLSGIEPSCNTLENLIKGHCWVGDLDAALLAYDDLRRRGFGPDAECVDEVLEEMCKRGRAKEGLKILREEMRREGFCSSRRSYEVLIGGFCKEGEMEEALKLQAEMAGKGFDPGPKVYKDFIEGYSEQGDVQKSKRLRDEMVGLGLEEEESEET